MLRVVLVVIHLQDRQIDVSAIAVHFVDRTVLVHNVRDSAALRARALLLDELLPQNLYGRLRGCLARLAQRVDGRGDWCRDRLRREEGRPVLGRVRQLVGLLRGNLRGLVAADLGTSGTCWDAPSLRRLVPRGRVGVLVVFVACRLSVEVRHHENESSRHTCAVQTQCAKQTPDPNSGRTQHAKRAQSHVPLYGEIHTSFHAVEGVNSSFQVQPCPDGFAIPPRLRDTP